MNIGLFFGSFNPIHTGHLIIANYIVENTNLDKIWFIISPQNPLKASHSLLNEYDRLSLVELAIKDNDKFRVSNVEFTLPKPSYTIDTLSYLTEKFPLMNFKVILGGDSYQNLPKWKNYEQILKYFPLIVYNRPGFEVVKLEGSVETILLDAPLIEISATFIRNQIKDGKSIKYLVPDEVRDVIEGKWLYK